MLRIIQTILITLALLNTPRAFALVDIYCVKYDPAIIALTGKLEAKTFAGAPNYLSIAAGDMPETGYYIQLNSPICTISKEETWMLAHDRISEVQLVLSKDLYERITISLGKVLSVKGLLFEAFNEHHHTQVLLEVKSFEIIENKALQPNPTSTKIAKSIIKLANLQGSIIKNPTKDSRAAKKTVRANLKRYKK